MIGRDIYLKQVRGRFPLLFTFIDRNPFSSTYGCCARDYWHYRFYTMPNACFQEIALPLAQLHSYEFSPNPYRENPRVLSWINAILAFWCKIQNPTGSYDEVYRNQDCYGATVSSSYCSSEVLHLLGERIDPAVRHDVHAALEKACQWIISTDEIAASNQVMTGAAALASAGQLLNREDYVAHAGRLVAGLEKRGSREGWLPEYNGADIGYTFYGLDWLAKYYLRTKDPVASGLAARQLAFAKHFVFEDGTVGGEFGSRNTEYMVPHGLEVFARENGDARALAGYLRANLESRRNQHLHSSMDDRYFAYFCSIYLSAWRDAADLAGDADPLPCRRVKPDARYYAEAGLDVRVTPGYHFVSNYKKGGVFKVVAGDFAYVDDGIFGRRRDGTVVSSQQLANATLSVAGSAAAMEGVLHEMPKILNSPFKQFALAMYNQFAPKFLRRLFLDWLRAKVVSAKPTGIRYERKFAFTDPGRIVVEDHITGIDDGLVELRVVPDKSRAMFFASTSFFQEQELSLYQHQLPDLAKTLREKGEVRLVREINCYKGTVSAEIIVDNDKASSGL